MFSIPNGKVKIVATLGPASFSREGILALAREGADVFRINLSHSSVEDALRILHDIRGVEKELKRPLAVLGDLPGSKIRIRSVVAEKAVEQGDVLLVSPKAAASEKYFAFTLNFPAIIKSLKKGMAIYLGDGVIKLLVDEKIPEGVLLKVDTAGTIKQGMGFSVLNLPMPQAMIDEDVREKIEQLVHAGADTLVVSSVKSGKDIGAVRRIAEKALKRGVCSTIFAKIETPEAVENRDEIFKVSDGVMIGRGDLGLSVPIEELPNIQRQLIDCALKYAKPVITATQMMTSMVHNPFPTRADVSDIAHAAWDGTDAIMFSEETATGDFPVEVVRMAGNIIRVSEGKVLEREFAEGDLTADAISAQAVKIANQIKSRLIIVFTQSGATARRISRHRPGQPILALSPEISTVRKLNFSWGVYGMLIEAPKDQNSLIALAHKVAAENGFCDLKKGEHFVISAGIPFGKSGTTNMILVEKV